MARCEGPPCHVTDLTRELGKTHPRAISKRNALIKKGLIYAPRHGTVDYTVPRFTDYLRRRDGSSPDPPA